MSIRLLPLRLLTAATLILALADPSAALTVTISASDSGWHSNAGNHTATNQDYEAGWSSNEQFRNFFVFDLSSLPLGETILSATLRAYNPIFGVPNVTFGDGYDSPDASETYNLHEVLLPAALVTAPSVLTPVVYGDLGDGAIFGSYLASSADNGDFIEIALNGAGITAAQTWVGLGSFVLGGEISTLALPVGVDEFVFGHTDPPGFGPYTRELVLEITPEPGTGGLFALGLVALASARRRRIRGAAATALGAVALLAALAPGAASAGVLATTEIKVLSNRADLISGGDALVEVVPAPPSGTTVYAGASNVTSSFALRSNGRFMGIVSALPVGVTQLTVTLPDSTGAMIAIANHPIEGPVFSGPHLQPWDCTTDGAGLGQPTDANCNAPSLVEYLYVPTSGGGYVAYDTNSPPSNVGTITNDRGQTVRNIIRRESGAINRGLYAFAVLHDPALGAIAPWNPQSGWNGKMFYPFGASCNTNQTQGSSKTSLVTNQARLQQGYLVATTSLNELGHHCNPIISAETAMMAKERIIETVGPIRFTISTGGSGGAIGQLQVSQMYPGITNGLIPSQMFADVWTTAIEVADCFLTETYWPKAAVPFTILQKTAVDGHGPTQSSCAAWVALFVPSGIPSHGCFSGSTLPTTSTPDPARDYAPVVNPDGCRATVNDLQVNAWGRRPQDDFAKRPIDNFGVQYGIEALNRPLTDPAKITMAQFLDMNLKIGGVDIDGVPTLGRTRADTDVSRIAYRSGNINDGRGLARAAILNLAAPLNVEIHTPYHAYALEARMAAIGHQDNHAIWDNAPEGTAFTAMSDWLTAVEAAGGIDATGMDPAKVKANRPATADDSCWRSGSQTALPGTCAAEVFGDSRLNAGMPSTHDVLECQLKPINPADYPGAGPLGPTAVDLALLAQIFPQGVCDYTKPREEPGPVGAVAHLRERSGRPAARQPADIDTVLSRARASARDPFREPTETWRCVMRRFACSLLFLLLPAAAFGATIVAPNGLELVEGNEGNSFPFNNVSEARYQQAYAASQFSNAPISISEIAFRVDGNAAAATFASIVELQLALSTSASPVGSLSLTFADNVGADEVVVLAQQTLPLAGIQGGTGGPNAFDVSFVFDTAFTYDPNFGDLLLDVSVFSATNVLPPVGFSYLDSEEDVSGYTHLQRVWDSTDVTALTGQTDLHSSGLVTRFTYTVVPEPGTGLLVIAGLLGLAARRRGARSAAALAFAAIALPAAIASAEPIDPWNDVGGPGFDCTNDPYNPIRADGSRDLHGDPLPGEPEWDLRDEEHVACTDQRDHDARLNPFRNVGTAQYGHDPYREPDRHQNIRFRYQSFTQLDIPSVPSTEIFRPCPTDPSVCPNLPAGLPRFDPPYPVVLVFHGFIAQKEHHRFNSQVFAENGYMAIAVNGTSPGVPGPNSQRAQNGDDVLRWLAGQSTNALGMPIDPGVYGDEADLDRVAFTGHSQGAGVSLGYQGDPRVHAIIAWDGGDTITAGNCTTGPCAPIMYQRTDGGFATPSAAHRLPGRPEARPAHVHRAQAARHGRVPLHESRHRAHRLERLRRGARRQPLCRARHQLSQPRMARPAPARQARLHRDRSGQDLRGSQCRAGARIPPGDRERRVRPPHRAHVRRLRRSAQHQHGLLGSRPARSHPRPTHTPETSRCIVEDLEIRDRYSPYFYGYCRVTVPNYVGGGNGRPNDTVAAARVADTGADGDLRFEGCPEL